MGIIVHDREKGEELQTDGMAFRRGMAVHGRDAGACLALCGQCQGVDGWCGEGGDAGEAEKSSSVKHIVGFF